MKTLKSVKWMPFNIQDICEIASGRDIYDRERLDGELPYVTATASNNGIGYFVGNKNETLESGCLSVNRNGSVGFSFYHPYAALYGNDTRKLRPYNQNRYVCFFLSRMITAQKEKYGYGLKLGTDRLKKQQIMLPVTSEGNPDFNFMEQYMRNIEEKLLKRYALYINTKGSKLNEGRGIKRTFKEVLILDYFIPKKGNQNKMNLMTGGHTPLVSAKKVDNGYKDFVDVDSKALFTGHCITLNNDGDGGAGIAFYQPADFALDSHVTALYPKVQLSKYQMIYIANCISKQRILFGHGRSINSSRLSHFICMLPVTSEGNPDFNFMEEYMREKERKIIKRYIDFRLKNV